MKRRIGPTVCFLVTAEITATTFYRGYLRYLADSGLRVILIASPAGGLTAFGRAEGITVLPIRMQRNPSPLNDMLSFAQLLWRLSTVRPDALVFATPKASLLGSMAGTILRVPVRQYQLWGLRLETVVGFGRKVLMGAERITALCSTEIVANSGSLASAAVEQGATSGKIPIVIGYGSSHGIDLARYRREADFGIVDSTTNSFLSEDELTTIGFVGRIHTDKGIDTLLDALQTCRDNGVIFKTMLIGRMESERLRKILSENKDKLLHYVGEVGDTRPYISRMDIHCLPSRREGFPNVVLEASAMGVTSIVSNATGAIDSVVDGVTGLIFDVDDSSSLADAITELVINVRRRECLANNALAYVRDKYSTEIVWPRQRQHLLESIGVTKR